MKQFRKILKFEFGNYLYNKMFVGITLFLVLLMAAVMFFPRLMEAIDVGENDPAEERPVMLVAGEGADEQLKTLLGNAFDGYDVKRTDEGLEAIKKQITEGEAECAVVLEGLTSYTYYVNNLSMYDTNTAVIESVMQSVYRLTAMAEKGISAEEAADILAAEIRGKTESLGKDQMQNFFYTYIMIFALYMVILLYGQMIATNVASEKSSRAMELLVTSADPTAMMFGKVIASCLAGLAQLIAIFGSALLLFRLNKSYWEGNMIMESIFDIPVDLFVYLLVFFLLGFFIFAFLFGAAGSIVSKLEDVNTAVMPVTMMFVIGFMVVMFSMASGNVDTTLMKVCSFIPFTSSMAMFTRIAMSTVPVWEIAVSIGILILSVIAAGVVSAKIYRMGVLLYGNKPTLRSVLLMMRNEKKNR